MACGVSAACLIGAETCSALLCSSCWGLSSLFSLTLMHPVQASLQTHLLRLSRAAHSQEQQEKTPAGLEARTENYPQKNPNIENSWWA